MQKEECIGGKLQFRKQQREHLCFPGRKDVDPMRRRSSEIFSEWIVLKETTQQGERARRRGSAWGMFASPGLEAAHRAAARGQASCAWERGRRLPSEVSVGCSPENPQKRFMRARIRGSEVHCSCSGHVKTVPLSLIPCALGLNLRA